MGIGRQPGGNGVPLRPAAREHRLTRSGVARRIWHDHGLSIVLIVLFLAAMVGQTLAGWETYNEEQLEHGQEAVDLRGYLRTGHFGEATFENWESEFLQMAFFVILTAILYQRGSSESKRPDVLEDVDRDPRESPDKASAPWPVRRGGMILVLYENSLSIAFTILFLASFALHATTGFHEYNSEQIAHGQPVIGVVEFVVSARFWFESFQNWQSEFLALAAMVMLSIFLRQRGSPESKPVDAPLWETGK